MINEENLQKSSFIIDDKRSLLKIFAAKTPLHTLYFIIPMLIFLAYLLKEESFNYTEVITLSFLGMLYWSLVEYVIHRFAFHFKSANEAINFLVGSFHTYHHQNPKDTEVLTSGWFTALLGLFFHGAILFIVSLGSTKYAYSILLTMIVTYFFYEVIHYQVHMKIYKKGVMKYLQDFHLTHHIRPKKNFGQMTPIWDYLFNTVTKNEDTMTNKQMKKFIKETRK